MKKFKLNLRRLVMCILFILGCTIQAQAQTQEPFITTWEVTAGDLSITIPTFSNPAITGHFTYAYTVDWGDGTIDTTTYKRDATYTYQRAGTYTVAISGNFPAIYFNNLHPQVWDNSLEIKTIKSWGTQRWLSLADAFEGCQSLTTIEDGAGVPDLTMVTNMNGTFSWATNFNGDLSSWDVSNVTSMISTFFRATSFNQDISSWNVSKVTSMGSMFFNATSFNQDISSWDVSNVTTISNAFRGATSFNEDLSSWNVSNVGNMWWTFADATSFNQDISSWNVSNVTTMWSTFNGASSFNGDLSSWSVSNVNDMDRMFKGATSFNQDISSWNVSNVTNMYNMFTNATSFSSENYDALLTGWSSLSSLQDDVNFGAPPTTYCNGKTGRGILTGTYNWTITGDNGEDCSAVTSVDDEFLSNTKIYPNPSNGKISIESSFEIDKLELYNVLGAKLFSVSKTNVLDLTSLSQGIYILKVFSVGRVFAKKVIKD